jgi:crossover junction endodeoxyribonuclease RuvC
MKIISIDPGYERVGIAVLEKEKSGQKETLIFSECFKTSAKLPMEERLVLIGSRLEGLIKKYSPKIFAIENLFFQNNAKTVMGVSQAKGVLIYVAKKNNLDVHEYTPLQIKNATTGYGKATKLQVYEMVKQLIDLPKDVAQDDEIDAIAVGLTCSASVR